MHCIYVFHIKPYKGGNGKLQDVFFKNIFRNVICKKSTIVSRCPCFKTEEALLEHHTGQMLPSGPHKICKMLKEMMNEMTEKVSYLFWVKVSNHFDWLWIK